MKQSTFFGLFSWILPRKVLDMLQSGNDASIHQAVLSMQNAMPLRTALFTGFGRYLDQLKLKELLSYDLFPWASSEIKTSEWDYAKQQLSPKGILLPDGTKLSRKEHAAAINHSFIVIDRTIFAMAPKGQYLGKGLSARAKLGEDPDGGVWAIKIRRLNVTNTDRSVPDSPELEEQTTTDLGKALKSASRVMGTLGGFFSTEKYGKHYHATVFLGQTLMKYLEQHNLTAEDRYELAINAVLALHDLHSGKDSKKKIKYAHNDLNAGNITIDKNGKVHLIDYGSSASINKLSKDKYEQACRNDMADLIGVLKHVFTDEMQRENGEELMKYLSNNDAYYRGRSSLPLPLQVIEKFREFQTQYCARHHTAQVK